MTYGVLPASLAGGGQLSINKTSEQDDFPDHVRLDPGDIEDNWASGDAQFVRNLPIYDIGAQKDDVGAVYRNTADSREMAVRPVSAIKPVHLWIAAGAVGALAGATAAALIWRRRR